MVRNPQIARSNRAGGTRNFTVSGPGYGRVMAVINGYPILAWRAGMFQLPTRGQTYIYEHREVAARALGRTLNDEEYVHHEDEDRGNNAPANLYVFRTNGDHLRYHATNVRVDMGDGTWTSPAVAAVCACGRERDPKANLCGTCWAAARRSGWPTADELRELVWSMPLSDVGERFGVTYAAVNKWCKALGVDKPPRGYWTRRSAGE